MLEALGIKEKARNFMPRMTGINAAAHLLLALEEKTPYA